MYSTRWRCSPWNLGEKELEQWLELSLVSLVTSGQDKVLSTQGLSTQDAKN